MRVAVRTAGMTVVVVTVVIVSRVIVSKVVAMIVLMAMAGRILTVPIVHPPDVP
jgi:hypothetical protein